MIKIYETSSNEFASSAIIAAKSTIEANLLEYIEFEAKITSPYF